MNRNLSPGQFNKHARELQLPMFVPAKHLVDGTVGTFNPGDLMEVEETYDGGWTDPDGDRWETEIRNETPDEGWDRKLDEAHQYGGGGGYVLPDGRMGSLYDSIEAEGVRGPVRLSAYDLGMDEYGSIRPVGTIMDGHHRAAAAADIDPDAEVPVMWRGATGGPGGRPIFGPSPRR